MNELQSWWQMAQVAGAGATLVLGPVVYALWRRTESDMVYMRSQDKSNLEVLLKLTNLLESFHAEHKEGTSTILRAIAEDQQATIRSLEESLRQIREAITQHSREHNRHHRDTGGSNQPT